MIETAAHAIVADHGNIDHDLLAGSWHCQDPNQSHAFELFAHCVVTLVCSACVESVVDPLLTTVM